MAARSAALEGPIVSAIPGAGAITWLSPLAQDDFAEYRDADFLRPVRQEFIVDALAAFWPARGPQWDALGLTDRGDVLLV